MALYYNSHYIQAVRMMGKPNCYLVFQFMLDRLAEEKSEHDIIHVSAASIASACNIYRNGMNDIIQQLCNAKLISNVSQSKCKNTFQIHIARYVSLISAYMKLDDDKRDQFTQAMYEGNERLLKEFGVCEEPGMREQFLGIKSKYLPNLHGIEQNAQNCTEQCKNEEIALNSAKQPKMLYLVQIPEKCTKSCKNGDFAPFYTHILEQFKEDIALKRAFLDILDAEIASNSAKSVSNLELESVFSVPESFFEQYPTTKTLVLGIIAEISLLQNCTKTSIGLHEIVQFLGTVYNNIKNKKKFGIEDSSKESSSLSKTSFEQDEEIDDEEWEPIKFFQTKVKKKKDYPHFQESEVREWLDHPELCVNDDYKLFLYNLILEIEIRYHVEEKRDEEGNITREESYDDTPIVEQSTLQEILKSALEFTEEAIQDKQLKLDYEDGEQILPVNIDTFDSDRLLSLLDWEGVNTGANDKELRYQVDWSKINIIDQELIPVVDKTNRTTRRSAESIDQVDDERTLDKEYEKQLFNCENTSQLSPIESIVSTILREYFQQDETGDIVLINHGAFIPRDVLKGYTLQYRESGITLQDIAKVTRRCKLDDHENLSTRAQRMFSALQIQYWNNKHGYQSLIS